MASERDAPARILMMPYYGDGNPYLRLLSEALQRRGLTVDLARIRGWTPLWSAVRETGRPNIVHLHWHHRFFVPRRGGWLRSVAATVLFFSQWLSLRLLGTRFIWTVHNITNHEGQRRRWELRANRVLARIVDQMIVHCAAVIPDVAEAFRVPADRFEVCPHGTYGDWYSGPESREDARERVGLPATARVLLFFGLIRSYKGVDRLIRTFRAMEGDDLRLVVMGSPKSEGLKKVIADLAETDPRVEAYLEFVEDDRLAAYLKACNAVVLPYRDSLTSGAAVLAGAAHRPVVMPRLGCMKEFPDDAGYFYDPEDPEALGAALVAACQDTGDARGEAAARHVGQFTWDGVAGTMAQIYDGVRGGQGKSS